MAEEKAVKKEKRPTPIKRHEQSLRRKARNRSTKSRILNAVRSFRQAPATEQLNPLYSLLDKAVKKGVISINKAARMKSRLTRKTA